MTLLLFVRAMDDVMPAVEAASEFPAHQQRLLEGSRQSDDLMPIWIERALERAFPVWSMPSLHLSSEAIPPRASTPVLPISKLGASALSERLGSSTTEIKARSYQQNMQQD